MGQRKIENNEDKTVKTPNKLCSRFQNSTTYFKSGICFSWTGVYCPTFRISPIGPYDHGASAIFVNVLNTEQCLGIISSKLVRYLSRTMINHTVNFGIEDIKKMPVALATPNEIGDKVSAIISKQRKDRYYDYASHEQIEIDKLVYDAYGLNEEDINEVETWFARRYPKLAAAQRSNLEKLKKA